MTIENKDRIAKNNLNDLYTCEGCLIINNCYLKYKREKCPCKDCVVKMICKYNCDLFRQFSKYKRSWR